MGDSHIDAHAIAVELSPVFDELLTAHRTELIEAAGGPVRRWLVAQLLPALRNYETVALETAIGLSLAELVHPGRISLKRMIELFTTGPAGILKLNRGTLAPGAPADVTIFDLEREWTYDVAESFSKSRNSPFHGRKFRGGPVAAIAAGELIWKRH